jgi:uncharacterized protein (DUF488 family)
MHLLTVGHSNRGLHDFMALLVAHGVHAVADVRRHPASRRFPHYSAGAIERTLREAGVVYAHLPELGGMRAQGTRPGEGSADSPHLALAEGAFRAYADHMASDEFARGIARLLALAAGQPTAFMCAEADPAHCHRSLLADALLVRGHTVGHIVDAGAARAHALHTRARSEGGRLVYDGGQGRLPLA